MVVKRRATLHATPRVFSWITMVKGLGGRSSKDKANDRKKDTKKRWDNRKKDKANDRKKDNDDDEEIDYLPVNYFTELSRQRYGKDVCNIWYSCPTCDGWHTNSQTWTWKNTPLGRKQVCELCAPLF